MLEEQAMHIQSAGQGQEQPCKQTTEQVSLRQGQPSDNNKQAFIQHYYKQIAALTTEQNKYNKIRNSKSKS